MLEGNGEVDLSQITSTKISIDETIKETDNTIEDLDKQLEDEYTTLAVDLKMIDEEIFLGEDIPFEELAKWLEKNENAYIIANAKENNKEIFTKIMKEHKALTPRIIPEIDDLGQHYSLAIIKYKNIILNIEEDKYTDEEILDFLERYELLAVIMDKDKAKTELAKKIRGKGIMCYVKDPEIKEINRQ